VQMIGPSQRPLPHISKHSQETDILSASGIRNRKPSSREAANPQLNPLTPNEPYSGRTAPLTSKRCILYINSTNKGTEYFKHDIYSPFFSLQNAVCFIILTYLVTVLFTFYIQDVLKFEKNNSGARRLRPHDHRHRLTRYKVQ